MGFELEEVQLKEVKLEAFDWCDGPEQLDYCIFLLLNLAKCKSPLKVYFQNSKCFTLHLMNFLDSRRDII
jgi:hypothetical protein